MKQIIFLFLLLPFLSFAQKDSICVLKGHLVGLGNKKITLSYMVDDARYTRKAKKIKAHNDDFTFTAHLAEPSEYYIYYYQKKTKHQKYIFHSTQVFLQNGNLTMTGLLDSIDNAQLKGSPINDEFKAEKKAEREIYEPLLKAEQLKDTTKKVRYLNKEQMQPLYDYINQYIRSHPSSYVSSALLYDNYSYDV
jgi:hypothetical protein